MVCDVCLCAYTSHGHCGVPIPDGDGRLDNAASIQRLAEVRRWGEVCLWRDN